MLVAIDGPAGAGKSTVARAVAQALGFTYLDTGAMYRCVALARLRDPQADPAALAIDVGERVTLDGEDVTERDPRARGHRGRLAVAADPAVRAAMVERQRALIARRRLGRRGPRHRHRRRARTPSSRSSSTPTPQERARRRASRPAATSPTVLAEQEDAGCARPRT